MVTLCRNLVPENALQRGGLACWGAAPRFREHRPHRSLFLSIQD